MRGGHVSSNPWPIEGQFGPMSTVVNRSQSSLPFASFVQRFAPAPTRLVQQLIIEKNLRTGVDIGCGEFSILSPMRSSTFRTTGLDAFEATIDKCKAANTHDDYICANFLETRIEQQFDVVVLNHVIEHFDRDTGFEVLRRLEAMAKRLIYIGTPNGFKEQMGYGGNKFQRHLSGWFTEDFEARGYNVFGFGPRALRGVQGVPKYFPEPMVRLIERSTRWYYYRRPKGSSGLGAIKYIDEDGNVRQL
jgi:hypothetical protein